MSRVVVPDTKPGMAVVIVVVHHGQGRIAAPVFFTEALLLEESSKVVGQFALDSLRMAVHGARRKHPIAGGES